MKPLLILKVGSTVAPLIPRRGDFDDWILAGMNRSRDEALVIDPRDGSEIPDPDSLCGVVVTGSSAMVTDEEDWSVRSEEWLSGAVQRGLPTLGICYGHQMLARVTGGAAGWNPKGREIGSIVIERTKEGERDRLLGFLDAPVTSQATHSQTVTQLPPTATLLGRSTLDEAQAFRIGELAWGVQFHPEFDADIIRGYLEDRRADIAAEGLDVDALIAASRDTSHGPDLLARFDQIVRGKG